jgi:hypothetical protein
MATDLDRDDHVENTIFDVSVFLPEGVDEGTATYLNPVQVTNTGDPVQDFRSQIQAERKRGVRFPKDIISPPAERGSDILEAAAAALIADGFDITAEQLEGIWNNPLCHDLIAQENGIERREVEERVAQTYPRPQDIPYILEFVQLKKHNYNVGLAVLETTPSTTDGKIVFNVSVQYISHSWQGTHTLWLGNDMVVNCGFPVVPGWNAFIGPPDVRPAPIPNDRGYPRPYEARHHTRKRSVGKYPTEDPLEILRNIDFSDLHGETLLFVHLRYTANEIARIASDEQRGNLSVQKLAQQITRRVQTALTWRAEALNVSYTQARSDYVQEVNDALYTGKRTYGANNLRLPQEELRRKRKRKENQQLPQQKSPSNNIRAYSRSESVRRGSTGSVTNWLRSNGWISDGEHGWVNADGSLYAVLQDPYAAIDKSLPENGVIRSMLTNEYVGNVYNDFRAVRGRPGVVQADYNQRTGKLASSRRSPRRQRSLSPGSSLLDPALRRSPRRRSAYDVPDTNGGFKPNSSLRSSRRQSRSSPRSSRRVSFSLPEDSNQYEDEPSQP